MPRYHVADAATSPRIDPLFAHERLARGQREGEGMLAILGLVIVAATILTFWRLLPKDGKIHPLATAPFLESIIPIGLIAGLSFGLVMMATVFMR
jgi:hypothetical protein